MSVIQSVTEKFEEIMVTVKPEPIYNQTAILESRNVSIKKPPLHESRKRIEKDIQDKKDMVKKSKAQIAEAAQSISELHSKLVLEGIFDQAEFLNPNDKEKISELKYALSEAAIAAKEYLQ